jgi:hypothetical protein
LIVTKRRSYRRARVDAAEGEEEIGKKKEKAGHAAISI